MTISLRKLTCLESREERKRSNSPIWKVLWTGVGRGKMRGLASEPKPKLKSANPLIFKTGPPPGSCMVCSGKPCGEVSSSDCAGGAGDWAEGVEGLARAAESS